eukprot:TRINITY_DN7936_c0_g1_i1.p1 TRINITY_DN7936_c0_g1~~TRINITY_DN7936_c0_g1_i1.p1  ORF type:complete len:583 (+),score=88.83 TRINITY_DN7936_c0_g1_i1:122-1870(+)
MVQQILDEESEKPNEKSLNHESEAVSGNEIFQKPNQNSLNNASKDENADREILMLDSNNEIHESEAVSGNEIFQKPNQNSLNNASKDENADREILMLDSNNEIHEDAVTNVEPEIPDGVSSNKESEVDHQAGFCAALLQPSYERLDADYVGTRRLLLYRKRISDLKHRKAWRCNGNGYVAYRNYIYRLKNGDHMHLTSQLTTPGDSGRWAASPSPLSIWNLVNDMHNFSFNSSRRVSFSSTASEADRFQTVREPAYSFVGMHCIFDKCNASVSVVKFGHLSSELLAYGAADGSLMVCNVTEPPSIIHQLKGHSKEVTDFDFSSNNQYISSCSMDKSVRVWDIGKGNCIRVVFGTTPQLCIRFHPVNNNFLLVGNANKEITVINFSTGRVINKLQLENVITSMDTDHTGQFMFLGDSEGCIHSITVSSHTGELSRTHKNNRGSISKSSTASVEFRTFSLLQHGPVLLTCTKDGNISFFSVALEIGGYLSLKCSLKLSSRQRKIQASFCPLLSLEKGEFIVSGSEDSNVYFYDLTRPKHPCVNKLQGHAAPVLGVSWNHGENLLASSDSHGVVIVWKRANLKGH